MSLLFAVAVLAAGCAPRLTRTTHAPSMASSISPKSTYLKAHMKDGRVYILSKWHIAPDDGRLTGEGRQLDPNRVLLSTGQFSVPLDSVALFESNVLTTAPQVAGMALVTGVSAAMTLFCITNPKACFGSCPTFYVEGENGPVLRAEGFSSSIAPCLEATDLDCLHRTAERSSRLEIQMRNEALETHVVRHADLIAVPVRSEARAMAFPDGTFRQVGNLCSAAVARAPEGSVAHRLSTFDLLERWSPADSTDLASREEIDLRFETSGGDSLCIIIAARQSLLSTYVFYQSLAWMGSEAGTWLARLERGDSRFKAAAGGAARLLGGIEVLVPDSTLQWSAIGTFQETGPLATDLKAIPLPTGAGREIRLRLAKGHWRLDWVAVGRYGPAETPIRLSPAAVMRNGRNDPAARKLLLDPERALITLPGDTLTLCYDVPDDATRYDLFLESRGYYLEWIRTEWLADENQWLAARLFLDPPAALKALAPAYKSVEADIENVFWNSRFAAP